MELRAHKFLVTGGGSGIGRAIAEQLLADGASVVIAGRTESKLKQAASELGGDVYTLTLDISDCESIPSKLLTAERLLGGLDGFVNAAALGCARRSAADMNRLTSRRMNGILSMISTTRARFSRCGMRSNFSYPAGAREIY